ncbi:toluene hydroxylase, partial [Paraburkholderia sp. SIMBA_055]
VQPDPKRYLLQDWILAFADGTPTYSETWTAAQCTDWHKFRAVDEEWERTHYQRQSTIVGMITTAVNNARRSGAVKRFDKTWVKVLEQH